jgi:NADH-quinone oxidoreductase subunit E
MSALPQAQRRLSEDAYRRIEREIAKYPEGRQQSAVMAALAIAQDELGWISPETIEEVAARLDMPPIAVYEVATFYSMYNLKPVGRHKITVCTNLPCALSGANAAAQRLKSRLGIGFGETTADGGFTLKEGECMGACGDAPVMVVDDKRMCGFMSDERIDGLLDELSGSGSGGEAGGGSKG